MPVSHNTFKLVRQGLYQETSIAVSIYPLDKLVTNALYYI
ncbi:hypothetical protein LCGC14_0295010 [marine sediment metagenome]|uniref:Uncharacterized protein n=1 Tax=marine sediment metagenome TaxID=412755 RepID=A0A0F9WXW4_9ZZZZ